MARKQRPGAWKRLKEKRRDQEGERERERKKEREIQTAIHREEPNPFRRVSSCYDITPSAEESDRGAESVEPKRNGAMKERSKHAPVIEGENETNRAGERSCQGFGEA